MNKTKRALFFTTVSMVIVCAIFVVEGIKSLKFAPYAEVMDRLSAEYGFKIEYTPELASVSIYDYTPEEVEAELRTEIEKGLERKARDTAYWEKYNSYFK